MSNEMKLFKFRAMDMRVVTKDGEPWFAATDVCVALDLGNVAQSLTRLDADEKGVISIDTLGGPQQTSVVSESGLYSLVLGCRKPEAKPFKRWVTHEVLPQIRKTGSYNAPKPLDLNDPVVLRQALLGYSERVIALEATVEAQKEPVAAYTRLMDADGSVCITDAAKSLQVRPKDLMRVLQSNRWVYRRPGGNGHWIAYQDKIQSGFLIHKVSTYSKKDGREAMSVQVRVTNSGMGALSALLGKQVAGWLQLN